MIDVVDETMRIVCLRYSTRNEVDHGLRRSTGAMKQEGMSTGKQSELQSLQILPDCLTLLEQIICSHYLQKHSVTIAHFQLNRFYIDFQVRFLKEGFHYCKENYWNRTVNMRQDEKYNTNLSSLYRFLQHAQRATHLRETSQREKNKRKRALAGTPKKNYGTSHFQIKDCMQV